MNKKNKNFWLYRFQFLALTVFLSVSYCQVDAQEKEYKIGCIAFYNLENIFDTIDSPDTQDSEFTPTGSKKWDTEKYDKKMHNMANVISQIGNEYIKGGPFAIGVSEVENRGVLEHLVTMPEIAGSNYKVILYESPDYRGIDNGLLYRPEYFTVTSSYPVKFTVPDDQNPYGGKFTSRDVLVVHGIMGGDEIHILVNHWPSKRGGKVSAPLRCSNADLNRAIADSILAKDANAKIIVMGDLNDDPVAKSLVKHLRAKGDETKLEEGDFYNPYYEKYKKGYGSTAYRDAWGLFDQIVVSQGFLGKDRSTYKYWKAANFSADFLKTKSGQYEGYPLRTFDFDTFQNGYSDHFPAYMFLIKEK